MILYPFISNFFSFLFSPSTSCFSSTFLAAHCMARKFTFLATDTRSLTYTNSSTLFKSTRTTSSALYRFLSSIIILDSFHVLVCFAENERRQPKNLLDRIEVDNLTNRKNNSNSKRKREDEKKIEGKTVLTT